MDVTVTVICRARGQVTGTPDHLVTFSSPDHHEPGVKVHVQVPASAPFVPGERYELAFRHDPYVPAHQRPGFDHHAHAAVRAEQAAAAEPETVGRHAIAEAPRVDEYDFYETEPEAAPAEVAEVAPEVAEPEPEVPATGVQLLPLPPLPTFPQ